MAILTGVVLITAILWLVRDHVGSQVQAVCGVLCFLGIAAACSENLRVVRLRIVLAGMALQVFLALLVLRDSTGRRTFEVMGDVIQQFLSFSQAGAEFVFGPLANRDKMVDAFGADSPFVFAFMALPPIIFISAFFSVLYYLGVMQLIVNGMAWIMRRTMGTGGAESLSASANVFMGQTEAPLLVRPYIPGMSRSQLLTLMVGGMATISGGMLAVYAQLGADPVVLLTTSVMAAPAGLYVAKILLPDAWSGTDPAPLVADTTDESQRPTGIIDAAALGARDGLLLALNVAAMLIVFVAFIALVNACLSPFGVTLQELLGHVFAPVAMLIGIEGSDIFKSGQLLGTKVVINEMVAFLDMGVMQQADPESGLPMAERSVKITTFALTGFANLASIGIQVGGIGAMAPQRRGELAKLGMRALLGGFLATLINASIAALLL